MIIQLVTQLCEKCQPHHQFITEIVGLHNLASECQPNQPDRPPAFVHIPVQISRSLSSTHLKLPVMSRGGMYAKMAAVFIACAAGGPAIMYYVTPAEGELFKRFNPDLQKRNLEMRDEREKNYKDFAQKMIEYSKSDKPIWAAEEEARQKARNDIMRREQEERKVREARAQEMRDERAREMRATIR